MILLWGLMLIVLANYYPAFAERIILKDGVTSITGKILIEKPSQYIVDLGYTVLIIPKDKVYKIENPKINEPTNQVQLSIVKEKIYYTSKSSSQEKSVQDLTRSLSEAVVQVKTPRGLGSGFFINEDGYLLTNFHVIEGETQISVDVYPLVNDKIEKKTYKEVRIVALNKFFDLALLKIEEKPASKFKYVILGNSDKLQTGDRVFAIGSPLGLDRTVTEGIISTKTREIEGLLYLQTTAQINPGNSGGPLFNLSGEVIGITNMKIRSGEGIGFAIPVNHVKYFLDHMEAFAYDNSNPTAPYRYMEPPKKQIKQELNTKTN